MAYKPHTCAPVLSIVALAALLAPALCDERDAIGERAAMQRAVSRDAEQPFPSKLPFAAIWQTGLLLNNDAEPPWCSLYPAMGWSWADLVRGDVKSLEAMLPDLSETDRGGAPDWHRSSLETKDSAFAHEKLHRWRLAHGCLWSTTAERLRHTMGPGLYLASIPFPISMSSPKQAKLEKRATPPRSDATDARGVDAPAKRADAPRTETVPVFARTDFLLKEQWRALYNPSSRGRGNYQLDFDFLPLSPRQVLLFVMTNEKITVWERRFEKKRAPSLESFQLGPWEGDWQKASAFDAPFAEPFHVAAAGRAYFFVTDSGAVYIAKETVGKWQTDVLWKDPARPVLAMLVESDGATAFVFGKDFYFKLARKPDPKPCREVTKGKAALPERARIVYECGRVLFEKGELRGAQTQK